jgi:hypothetical protein
MGVVTGGGGGGAAFNGGTITGALTVDRHTDDTNPALTVTAGATGTQGVAVAVDPSVPALKVRGLNADGIVAVSNDFNANTASVSSSSIELKAAGGAISRYEPDFTKNISLRPDGLWISVNAGPADGDLAAGFAAIWFDKTNGAAKLMVKAKQADGTVVTGSLALAP